MARPSFQPTEQQRARVAQLVSFGLTQKEICALVQGEDGKPISEKTLRKHFAEELAHGSCQANVRIAQSLYDKALNGDTAAMIFWMKTRAGWKQIDHLELTGKGGAPIQTQRVSADLSRLSHEELDLLERLAEKCAARGDPSGKGQTG